LSASADPVAFDPRNPEGTHEDTVTTTPPTFRFEPIGEADLSMLRGWLLRPHVAQWWGQAETTDELRRDFVQNGHDPRFPRGYIAYAGRQPLGFIQSYVVMGAGDGWWDAETDPGARGTDQFLAEPGQLGQGIGSAMVRAFLARLFDDASVTVAQTDPHPDNGRAIRSYRRAGFRPVGEVTTPDGPALLMRCTRAEWESRDIDDRPPALVPHVGHGR
jgi:RimJ/RimL family protein N-acetyltransferase